MDMKDGYSLEDLLSLTRKDKASFWKMMFERVKDSISLDLDYAVILEFKENVAESDEMVEVTSLLLDDNQFYPFLENYLIFCEEEENYEECSDIKNTIEQYLKKIK
jgi:hypothetical protein